VPVLELRGFSASRSHWPTRSDRYTSFRRALALSVEANMKAIPRKQRAMVREGIRNRLRSGARRWYRSPLFMPKACAISGRLCSPDPIVAFSVMNSPPAPMSFQCATTGEPSLRC
jgi:hypothetical protein